MTLYYHDGSYGGGGFNNPSNTNITKVEALVNNTTPASGLAASGYSALLTTNGNAFTLSISSKQATYNSKESWNFKAVCYG